MLLIRVAFLRLFVPSFQQEGRPLVGSQSGGEETARAMGASRCWMTSRRRRSEPSTSRLVGQEVRT